MSTRAECLTEEKRAFQELAEAVQEAVRKADRYSGATDNPREGVVEAAIHLERALALLRARRAA